MTRCLHTWGIIALVVLALPACSSVKKELGVARHSPDEFTVVKRAPLTLPPDYALKPPVDKHSTTEDTLGDTAAHTAKRTVFGAESNAAPAGESEQVLLAKMGAEHMNPAIRKQIDKDNGYLALQNQSLIDKLKSKKDVPIDSDRIPSSTVDAKAEAARIKQNLDTGKPINEGDVPVIEKKKNTLEKLF